MLNPTLNVVLFAHGNLDYLRRVLLGVRTFASLQQQWTLHVCPPTAAGLDEARQLQPDGLIASWFDVPLEDVLALDVPTVLALTYEHHSRRVTWVGCDHVAAGELAAKYFLKRGFRVLAAVACEFPSTIRWDGFKRAAARAGLKAVRYTGPGGEELAQWLVDLPKPAAVYVAMTEMAGPTAQACQAAGIDVPGQIAILSGGSDQFACEMTQPPLSAIDFPYEKLGRTAAEMLDRMMRRPGRAAPKPVIMRDFLVVTRRSTDVVATDDAEVRTVVAYIREHYGRTLSVPQIAERTSLGRRALEKRFRLALGRTILSEIQFVRLEAVKLLLRNTHLPMHAIARQCGFPTPERMCLVFRAAEGMTPTLYRQRFSPNGG